MGDDTQIFIPEEGRKRRSNEVSYIIVAFYGTSSLSDVNKRPSTNPKLQPAIIRFMNSLSRKNHTIVYFITFI